MPTIAFFPWLHIRKAESIGPFQLVPYRRGLLPCGKGSSLQEDLDYILGHYHERGASIENATLLQIGRRGITGELDRRTIREAFMFADLVAFCGMSTREFFGLGAFDYSNRDLYRLIIQAYVGRGGFNITTRRRDGNTSAYVVSNVYRVMKPEHVHAPMRLLLDKQLILGLLRARKSLKADDWKRVHGAIQAFNQANTDSSEVQETVELLLMIASMEQLLESTSSATDIGTRFTRIFSPTTSVRADSKPRVREAQDRGRFRHVQWLREAWVRDFYALRGHVAHKLKADRYPGVWTLEEHLLLGSFAVPLLAKQLLASQKLYGLSTDDRIAIDAFEHLCSRDLIKNPKCGKEWPWREVLGEAHFDHWWRENAH